MEAELLMERAASRLSAQTQIEQVQAASASASDGANTTAIVSARRDRPT